MTINTDTYTNMNTQFDSNTKTLTVPVPGDLVSTNADKLRQDLHEVLEPAAAGQQAWQVVKLDLTSAKMVDSVGLNLIVTILRAVQKSGAKMQVVCSNPNVHRTFLFTRLDKHIELIKI